MCMVSGLVRAFNTSRKILWCPSPFLRLEFFSVLDTLTHVNLNCFFQNAQNIALYPKLIVVFGGKVEETLEKLKNKFCS